ncbi:GNAT family N-acetyltransferase [Yinghuangia seranimata]|uniref:GNAT family N-acetyltransferase n=1 Tax=Yinghuangia seranimata TaxID=408067 RepID=UPI00248C1585|nr:GNAT family N-acetyltransferase [Yinghuangia seranimata]MDI2129740.1 GNAT family N-acetyltransferase [Yinghuangia seranimata]
MTSHDPAHVARPDAATPADGLPPQLVPEHPFPPVPDTVTGLGLVLRPWTEDDIPAMIAVLDNPEVGRWTRIPAPFGPLDAEARLARGTYGHEIGERIIFAVTEDGVTPVGEVLAFHERSGRERGVELGYSVAPHARGRGLASRSVRVMTAHAYDVLKAERVVLVISQGNEASEGVARATGFVLDEAAEPVEVHANGFDHVARTWVHRRG